MTFGPSRDSAFAKQLVATLLKDLPPNTMESQRGGASVNKITRQLEKTYKAAAEYQHRAAHRVHPARLPGQWLPMGLKNSGYPDDFVNVATEGLVVELSRSRKGEGRHSAVSWRIAGRRVAARRCGRLELMLINVLKRLTGVGRKANRAPNCWPRRWRRPTTWVCTATAGAP
jgi:hypothetical protein